MPLHVSSTVVLIARRSKLYYTASGIIKPVGGRPVHRLREDWLHVPMFFLCLQQNYEMVAKFQAATACFSCDPPHLNLPKLILLTPISTTLFLPQNCTFKLLTFC